MSGSLEVERERRSHLLWTSWTWCTLAPSPAPHCGATNQSRRFCPKAEGARTETARLPRGLPAVRNDDREAFSPWNDNDRSRGRLRHTSTARAARTTCCSGALARGRSDRNGKDLRNGRPAAFILPFRGEPTLFFRGSPREYLPVRSSFL